jgi:hypothetical protein
VIAGVTKQRPVPEAHLDCSFCALPPPNDQQLLLLFRHELMRQLLKLEKITEAAVETLVRFLHAGFSAFQGKPVEPNDITGQEKLAVYILHPPAALERIDYQPSAGVVFHPAKGSTTGRDFVPRSEGGHGSARLNPLESLAALNDHIRQRGASPKSKRLSIADGHGRGPMRLCLDPR